MLTSVSSVFIVSSEEVPSPSILLVFVRVSVLLSSLLAVVLLLLGLLSVETSLG